MAGICVCGKPWYDSDSGPCHYRCEECGTVQENEDAPCPNCDDLKNDEASAYEEIKRLREVVTKLESENKRLEEICKGLVSNNFDISINNIHKDETIKTLKKMLADK